MTLGLCVLGVGVLGPGLADWGTGRHVLRDPSTWRHAATVVPAPQRLPATERRRAGTVVKASIVVADQALVGSSTPDIDPASLATVFASSTGDPLNCHLLCEALASAERSVSPTRFTNSVHNAPAGYWHIAAQSGAASTSLAAFDASFAAGLLEAAVQCAATQKALLLVACDAPYPQPLYALRPLDDVFAVALLVAPSGGRALQLRLGGPATESAPRPTTTSSAPQGGMSKVAEPHLLMSICAHAGLEAMRRSIPAARALPLLLALAGEGASEVCIEVQGGPALHLSVAAE